MSTTIRCAQVLPNVVMAELTDDDDDGRAYVWCAVPGGRPRFSFSDPRKAGSHDGITVDDAPACDGLRDFRAFVEEKFGR